MQRNQIRTVSLKWITIVDRFPCVRASIFARCYLVSGTNEAKPGNVDASSSTSSILSCHGAKDSCRTPETVTSCERLAVARGRKKERKKESEQTERVRVVNVTRVTRAISQCCCPVLFAFTDPLSSLRIWRRSSRNCASSIFVRE